jgi:hypothetical protein
MLRWMLERENGAIWIELIWPRIRRSEGLLWIRQRTFGFSGSMKCWQVPAVFQEGLCLCRMKLVVQNVLGICKQITICLLHKVTCRLDRAVAWAASRCLPTASARFRTRGKSCGIYGGQSGTGQASSEYCGFPCHAFIPLIALQSLSSMAGTIGQ